MLLLRSLLTVSRRAPALARAFHVSPVHSATELMMPALSPTMTEGTIIRWNKKEGDKIAAGDVVFEVETDKAQIEVEAQEDGVLGKILKEATGDKVAVNTVIAYVLEEGEDASAVKALSEKTKAESKATAPAQPAPPPPPATSAPATPAQTPPAQQTRVDRSQVVSPAVSHLLHEFGLEDKFGAIAGSGPQRRVLKGDVLAYIREQGLSPKTVTHPDPSTIVVPKRASKQHAAAAEISSDIEVGEDVEDLQLFNKRLLLSICDAAKSANVLDAIAVTADKAFTAQVESSVNELKNKYKLPVSYGSSADAGLSVYISAPALKKVPAAPFAVHTRREAIEFYDYLAHKAPLSFSQPHASRPSGSRAIVTPDLYDLLGHVPQKGDPQYREVVSVRLAGGKGTDLSSLNAIVQSLQLHS
ncbi:pyridoxine biosynthesis protein [Sorochytrium milnesiophthora]